MGFWAFNGWHKRAVNYLWEKPEISLARPKSVFGDRPIMLQESCKHRIDALAFVPSGIVQS